MNGRVDVKTAQRTYFSIATLIILGFGEIRPVSPYAKSLAAVEAIVGQIFPTPFMARPAGPHGADK
ncbi:MAG: ion channel [Pseudomonadota bacterium]